MSAEDQLSSSPFLTPGEVAIMRKHFAQFESMQPCPVCGTSTWYWRGLHVVHQDIALPAPYLGPTRRILSLVCQRCFFVRDFDWEMLVHIQQLRETP